MCNIHLAPHLGFNFVPMFFLAYLFLNFVYAYLFRNSLVKLFQAVNAVVILDALLFLTMSIYTFVSINFTLSSYYSNYQWFDKIKSCDVSTLYNLYSNNVVTITFFTLKSYIISFVLFGVLYIIKRYLQSKAV